MQYVFICERRPDNNVSMQYFWFYLFSKICLFFSSHNDFFGVVKKLIWTPWQNWQKETRIIDNHEINSLSSSRELIQKQKFFHSNNFKRNILQGKNLNSFSTIKVLFVSTFSTSRVFQLAKNNIFQNVHINSVMLGGCRCTIAPQWVMLYARLVCCGYILYCKNRSRLATDVWKGHFFSK